MIPRGCESSSSSRRPPPPEGGTVTFTDTGLEVEAGGGTSLLDAGEEAGVLMPSGCRMGICFSCTTRKSEGTVRNILSGEESSMPDEDIRICVSAPLGDCSVEL